MKVVKYPKYPILQATSKGTKINIVPYIYKDIIIPAGYETNGANRPRFWWIVRPPFYPTYMSAVLVHDYLCDKEEYKKADKYFKEILKDIEWNIISKIEVAVVKLYHKIRYNQ